jgi:hypothetical protein
LRLKNGLSNFIDAMGEKPRNPPHLHLASANCVKSGVLQLGIDSAGTGPLE